MVRQGTAAALARFERGRQQEAAAQALRSEVATHHALKARGQVCTGNAQAIPGLACSAPLLTRSSPHSRLLWLVVQWEEHTSEKQRLVARQREAAALEAAREAEAQAERQWRAEQLQREQEVGDGRACAAPGLAN